LVGEICIEPPVMLANRSLGLFAGCLETVLDVRD